MSTIINLNTYLAGVKEEIEKLDEVSTAKILGTTFDAEDFDKLSHQFGKSTVLISCVGGNLIKVGTEFWCQATFGVYVLNQKDNDFDSIGYSSQSVDVCQKVLQMIKENKFGIGKPGVKNLVEINEFSVLPSDEIEEKGFVTWFVMFQQQLRVA